MPKFLRDFGITEFLGVEVYYRNTRTVFHFNLTEVVQMPVPMAVLVKVFGDVLRKEDVTGIATIHHPLRRVDAGAGNIRPSAYIYDPADRPAVHAHAQLEFGMFSYRAANLERAFHRRFRRVVKHQCHSIARRHGKEAVLCLG